MEVKFMDFEHKCGIYMCTCIENNKSYIGQSQDVKLRKCQHLSALRYNKHWNKYLQNAYNKYGEDKFVWEVLEYCDECDLDPKEIYWISYYDTYRNGFNANEGGLSNRNFDRTDEFKSMMSDKLKQSWDNDEERHKQFSERMMGENNPMFGKYGSLNPAYGKDHSGEKGGMYGKHQSEESKELNRIAHLGANNKMSKSVVCEETQVIFASQGEAGRAMHCDSSSINKCCRGVIKTAGGYHWRYATQEEIESLHKTHTA